MKTFEERITELMDLIQDLTVSGSYWYKEASRLFNEDDQDGGVGAEAESIRCYTRREGARRALLDLAMDRANYEALYQEWEKEAKLYCENSDR